MAFPTTPIHTTYIPPKSLWVYPDRGGVKWQGFFYSGYDQVDAPATDQAQGLTQTPAEVASLAAKLAATHQPATIYLKDKQTKLTGRVEAALADYLLVTLTPAPHQPANKYAIPVFCETIAALKPAVGAGASAEGRRVR